MCSNPFVGILLAFVFIAAGFGAIRLLVGIVDFIKNPSRPRVGSGCGSSGGGFAGYIGWSWGDSSSHSSSDFGPSDGGGGCSDGGG
jgi:hypothetical protein